MTEQADGGTVIAPASSKRTITRKRGVMAEEKAKSKDKKRKPKGRNHNGPREHQGRNGLHYGAHESHKAVTSQKGRTLDCK